jgi:hypothetical protein
MEPGARRARSHIVSMKNKFDIALGTLPLSRLLANDLQTAWPAKFRKKNQMKKGHGNGRTNNASL